MQIGANKALFGLAIFLECLRSVLLLPNQYIEHYEVPTETLQLAAEATSSAFALVISLYMSCFGNRAGHHIGGCQRTFVDKTNWSLVFPPVLPVQPVQDIECCKQRRSAWAVHLLGMMDFLHAYLGFGVIIRQFTE